MSMSALLYVAGKVELELMEHFVQQHHMNNKIIDMRRADMFINIFVDG